MKQYEPCSICHKEMEPWEYRSPLVEYGWQQHFALHFAESPLRTLGQICTALHIPLVGETVTRVQNQILQLIRDDVVPGDVLSYGELHDHVDANLLGDMGEPPIAHLRGDDDDPHQALAEYMNLVTDAVDTWIRLYLLEGTNPCPACGAPYGEHPDDEGHDYVPWADRHDYYDGTMPGDRTLLVHAQCLPGAVSLYRSPEYVADAFIEEGGAWVVPFVTGP